MMWVTILKVNLKMLMNKHERDIKNATIVKGFQIDIIIRKFLG